VIRNILFDWSGTLVDDLPAVLAATNHVFDQYGAPPLTLDRFRAEFCLPFKDFYTRFLPQVPITELERSFHGYFIRAQNAVRELPRARDFLLFCRERGLRSFVLSTIHPDYYAAQTAVNGFDKFIERAYLAVWDKRAKIAEVLADNRLAPLETMFVGDMQHDIETARHGGVFSCGVLTGYNRLEQLRASHPDLIVEHLGELREVLERREFDLRREDADHLPPHPVCTVGALIFNAAGQALMVRTQKWSGLWGIPGGKIKFGEASVEALRREIQEETNLQVEEIEFVLAQDCVRSREFYREAHFVLLNYTCRAAGPCDVRLNEEAQEFRWVWPEEALQMELNQPTRILLNQVKAAKRQEPPAMNDRTDHTGLV
jgi:phosphoglycolate phosphatase-like HAD superfamily hydrolase/ADP-ribose pyrophosphatase YjhB (NUDIX family)